MVFLKGFSKGLFQQIIFFNSRFSKIIYKTRRPDFLKTQILTQFIYLLFYQGYFRVILVNEI